MLVDHTIHHVPPRRALLHARVKTGDARAAMKTINRHLLPGDLEASGNIVYLLVATTSGYPQQGIFLVILNDGTVRLSAGSTSPLPSATYAVQVGEVQSSR